MGTCFNINGIKYTVDLSKFPSDITLNTFIREHAQLTGTKFMCLEGGCGACIVTLKGKHPVTGKLRVWAANSCLTLLNTCIKLEIVTCEGIGNRRDGYHPLQKRLAKMNGTQCGYCSPGFIMNMYSLLESKEGPLTKWEIENSFGGNICRCTGYRPILDTMKSFANDISCTDIEDLRLVTPKQCNKLCEEIFKSNQAFLFFQLEYEDGAIWYWPENLNELFVILQEKIQVNDEYILVGGNTAHGIYRRSEHIKHFIDMSSIAVLKEYHLYKEKLILGGNLSLSEAMEIFQEASKQDGFEYCQQLWQHFDLIANVPVRNNGTLAGNITIKRIHPEFPSDIFITFEALNVQVIINTDKLKQEKMPLNDYLKNYNKNQKAVHILTAFELKAYPKQQFIFKSYKITPRAQNAHAYVNAAFFFELDNNTNTIKSSRICFGGISPTYSHAINIENLLQNQNYYDKSIIEKIFKELPSSLEPESSLIDASPDYRRQLACGLLYKCLLDIAPIDQVKKEYISGSSILKRELSSGIQIFGTNSNVFPVTQPVEKLEAMVQSSGEAIYTNDIITAANTLHCVFVNAIKVGAFIEQIDASEALQLPGVMAFFSAKDIPGINSSVDTDFGYDHEEIFCSGKVLYYDQPLGLIVAIRQDIANRAANMVKVIYSHDNNLVTATMDDIFLHKKWNRIHNVLPSKFKEIKLTDTSDISGRGIFEMGLQYHFTMEPQTCIAVPFEEGLRVFSTTQWLDHTQAAIAKMLKLPAASIQLKLRRLGGAYGCKISRGNAVACAASLAAYKLNKPVRFVQTIESMMRCNGKRWACRSDYEFHVKSDGKIVGIKNHFYEDAGCSLNENPLPGHAARNIQNCYEFTTDNYEVVGNAVLTDAPSNTWCRAPGSVEAIAMLENIMEHIAFETKMDPADVRLNNLKKESKINELLLNFIKTTEYRERRKEIDIFNEQNRWLKRGIGLSIMEYPIFYEGQFTATVSVYHTDGSVVITHGGIEMGQGLNTKAAQVAAYILGISLEFIKIETSDTINGANSTVTGGAVSSESVCFAVRKACNTLNERFKPVKASLKKDASWLDVVHEVWKRNLHMTASENYKPGEMNTYSLHGLSLTEVEIDILTGNLLIKRVDILEDTGESLSPYVDLGQVEGAFVMCLGYWLTEQFKFDRQTGELLTDRTWHYKPPGAKDIPIDFRVELSQKNPNSGGFMRSKATGEPPSCLAVSVIFSIQHALQSARKDAGLEREWLRLGAPTTPEIILLNAGNDVASYKLS